MSENDSTKRDVKSIWPPAPPPVAETEVSAGSRRPNWTLPLGIPPLRTGLWLESLRTTVPLARLVVEEVGGILPEFRKEEDSVFGLVKDGT